MNGRSRFVDNRKISGKQNDKQVLFAAVLLIGAYTLACGFLFFMQAAFAHDTFFESDLPAHLRMAEDGWGYSLTAVVYRIASMLPGYYFWVAAFLALFAGGTMAASFWFLWKEVFSKLNIRAAGWSALCSAIAVNIVMPCFVKAVHYQRYVGYQSPSVWHNSTYTVMKFFALMTLVYYVRFAKEYKEKVILKDWILFTVFLTLSTATKTSFLLVFAPAAFIGLFFDLYRKVPIKRVLLFASAILPSLAIMLFQELVLFGEDTGNGIAIEFGYNVYLRAERPYFTMILSALFPVLVFLFNVIPVCRETVKDLNEKKLPKHMPFFLAWTMWLFGALQLLFLKETGSRALDGNFTWGYDICLFVLFGVSLLYFLENLRSKTFLTGKFAVRIIYASVLGAVFGYHMYCGLYFFIRLLTGVTYFMQG